MEGLWKIYKEEQFKNCLARGILTFNKYLGQVTDSDSQKTDFNSLICGDVADLIVLFEEAQSNLFHAMEEKKLLQPLNDEQLSGCEYGYVCEKRE